MRSLSIIMFLASVSGACTTSAGVESRATGPQAQSAPSGMIRGVVRNEDGWELGEIAVLAISENGGSRTGFSDRRGIYRIEDLAPGTYTLRVRRGTSLVLERTVTVSGGISRDVHLRVPTEYGDRPEQRSKPVVDRSLIHSSASRAW